MSTTTVTTKGQIVIPSKMRNHLNIKAGTRIHIEEDGQKIIIRPMNIEYFNKIAGVLDTKGKLTKALLEERSLEKVKEK